MRIALINSVCDYGSTGRICAELASTILANGDEAIFLYGRGQSVNPIARKIGNQTEVYNHVFQTRLFDRHGLASVHATNEAIRELEKFRPDCVHLHNLHGYYMNYEILFAWLKDQNIPVIWTIHDCWPYTGHCAFPDDMCSKWMTGCYSCKLKRSYPESFLFDRSEKNYKQKKIAFSGLQNMTIVTPSKWLAGEVKKSFLGKYPIETIYNGIDLDVFKPCRSNIREKLQLNDKKIILGVANIWSEQKGLKDFIQLARMIDDTWRIVLVGVSEKQKKEIPDNIIAFSRTDNTIELAQLYSAADVFVNPSKKETMGLVTAEALACGTPVITYNLTAVPEIPNESCGYSVSPEVENIFQFLHSAINIEPAKCRSRAQAFEKKQQYEKYIMLYRYSMSQ